VAPASGFDEGYELDDRYTRQSGRVFLTANQALVRLPLMQRQRDRAAGLDTAGFISGYRGSPLGIYDLALWQARAHLDAHHVRFQPGVNEDLAATAVWGSQQASIQQQPRYDGVFALWYGKGPGVDRACDALKHGSYAGSARYGGVLVLAGDDPGAKSSSIAHQSEPALIHCAMPILNPANVQEYLDLGLHGFALSRYSGCWVGFKCLGDTVESSASVEVGPERVRVVLPEDFEMPEGGLNIGWANYALVVERKIYEQRLEAARAYVRANGLDRVVWDGPRRRLGIVTTGKAFSDVRQALEELGLGEGRAAELGLSLYKLAMPWPIEPQGLRRFADGLAELLVVEEKRPIVEEQIASLLFNEPRRPSLLGKRDAAGAAFVPQVGELTPPLLVELLRGWLEAGLPGYRAPESIRVTSAPPTAAAGGLTRLPSFCSGCPHNRSTVVPEGSLALGGIGCHGMAVFLPERRTLAVTQMGGEGANWIGQAPFTELPHIFQNMGDGTYFHSGLLSIRAAVAAGVDITFKLLVNGAVAMTGGQPIEGEVMAGEVTTPEIVAQLRAEGVQWIEVVSDDVDKYPRDAFPADVRVSHRDDLDALQRELRNVKGVSALVYDQTCAAEARRLRRRGELPEPDRRILVNERVCEGCGDCNLQSNCISVEPLETSLGRKRTIDQSSCNKDYSCLEGYCPSFVSVRGGRPRRARPQIAPGATEALRTELPTPAVADVTRPYNVFVAGIGGSGVVTVGALLGMAAHLEGRGVSLLDMTGLSQKNGPVASHVRVAADPAQLHATRIAAGAADLVLGCDIVVTSAADSLARMSAGRTTALVDTRVAPTAEFATHADLDLSPERMEAAIRERVGLDRLHTVPATRFATALLGDAITANLFLLGYALQLGRLPVGLGALERAIELNGRAVELNKRALHWGRLAAHDRTIVERVLAPGEGASSGGEVGAGEEAAGRSELERSLEPRVRELVAYQDAAYAERYCARVEAVAAAERRVSDDSRLACAVARGYFKLLAYKDEYEVARLYTDGAFERRLENELEGDLRDLRIHLAPQFLPRSRRTGRPRKWALPARWILPALRVLARGKRLRGTPFDPFQALAHRRLERRLIGEYESVLDELLSGLSRENLELAVEIAALPEQIRGFDDVKERHLESVRAKQRELLDAFRRRV